MKITNFKKLKPKDLIVFDVDGTIARTKSPMDKEMAGLMRDLLKAKKVAVISGAKLEVIKMQMLDEIKAPKSLLNNLSLFPTTATTFYKHENSWKQVYALTLSPAKVKKIKNTFEKVFKEMDYKHPDKVYGELIENRGSQVSFSIYGQDLVKVLGKKGIKMKEEWKKKNTPVKMEIARRVAKYLPEFEVHAAGFTTIDVTNKGIDKGYGLHQIEKYLHVPIKQMLFVGDAIVPGGNDYAIVRTGVDYVAVKNPEDTKKLIRHLLK
jgi:phosphomannomutase